MAQLIQQTLNPQIPNEILRQADPGCASKDGVAMRSGVPLPPVPGKVLTADERIHRQLAVLNARIDALSAELQGTDRKWGKQFAGFQETATLTAEAVVGFDSELQAQQACLADFSAAFSTQAAAINSRSHLLTSTVESLVQELATYRAAVQKKLVRLYAGFGLLTLGLLATIGFIATAL